MVQKSCLASSPRDVAPTEPLLSNYLVWLVGRRPRDRLEWGTTGIVKLDFKDVLLTTQNGLHDTFENLIHHLNSQGQLVVIDLPS